MAKKQLRVRRLYRYRHTACIAHIHHTSNLMSTSVQGKAGNVAKYITRTRAVKRLQLRLAEFRSATALNVRCTLYEHIFLPSSLVV